jgi:hypothetical protein
LYILQESLFSFEELQKIESKERLPIFLVCLTYAPMPKRRKSFTPWCRRSLPPGILRALLAAPLENIDTFTGLQRRLEVDLRFR